MKQILNPNCSEIVWKLNVETTTKRKILRTLENKGGETCETDTANFPNGCLGNMINLLEEAKEDCGDINRIELIFIDNLGGGGNGQFVEDCFNIAKRYLNKEITRKQAEKLERNLWGA